jgi:hypothetical protein
MTSGECGEQRALPYNQRGKGYSEQSDCNPAVTESQMVENCLGYRVTAKTAPSRDARARAYARVKNTSKNTVTSVTREEIDRLDIGYSRGYTQLLWVTVHFHSSFVVEQPGGGQA